MESFLWNNPSSYEADMQVHLRNIFNLMCKQPLNVRLASWLNTLNFQKLVAAKRWINLSIPAQTWELPTLDLFEYKRVLKFQRKLFASKCPFRVKLHLPFTVLRDSSLTGLPVLRQTMDIKVTSLKVLRCCSLYRTSRNDAWSVHAVRAVEMHPAKVKLGPPSYHFFSNFLAVGCFALGWKRQEPWAEPSQPGHCFVPKERELEVAP